MRVRVKKLSEKAVIPKYATKGSSGFDLHSVEKYVVFKGQTVLVKTGLSMEIPEGFELQVRPRSGLSLKTYLRVANSPGTVDADYRGEICIIMTNQSLDTDYVIEEGERVAQGVLCPIAWADFLQVEDLSNTERGEGGFGSTGKR